MRAKVGDPAVGTVYAWAGVPTCRERARVPIDRCMAYVYSSTRVVRAVVCKHHACIVVHTCSGSARAVVVIMALDFLIVSSTWHALGGRYCTATGVQGVPLRG